jgi:hypothetical protein
VCVLRGKSREVKVKQTSAYTVISISGSWLILSAESREFSTNSRIVVYRHLPGCRGVVVGKHVSKWIVYEERKRQVSRLLIRSKLTLSKPAMFLFSAKNSAGDFCCRMSAGFLPPPLPLGGIANGCACGANFEIIYDQIKALVSIQQSSACCIIPVSDL